MKCDLCKWFEEFKRVRCTCRLCIHSDGVQATDNFEIEEPMDKEASIQMYCLHYNKDTDKCDMKSCTNGKRSPDGSCSCHGEGVIGHKEKHHNYLCSKERSI
jgi:hypothetical protein